MNKKDLKEIRKIVKGEVILALIEIQIKKTDEIITNMLKESEDMRKSIQKLFNVIIIILYIFIIFFFGVVIGKYLR